MFHKLFSYRATQKHLKPLDTLTLRARRYSKSRGVVFMTPLGFIELLHLELFNTERDGLRLSSVEKQHKHAVLWTAFTREEKAVSCWIIWAR